MARRSALLRRMAARRLSRGSGVTALLVAKLHKLGDRLVTPDRLQAEDAGDIYRLFDALAPEW